MVGTEALDGSGSRKGSDCTPLCELLLLKLGASLRHEEGVRGDFTGAVGSNEVGRLHLAFDLLGKLHLGRLLSSPGDSPLLIPRLDAGHLLLVGLCSGKGVEARRGGTGGRRGAGAPASLGLPSPRAATPPATTAALASRHAHSASAASATSAGHRHAASPTTAATAATPSATSTTSAMVSPGGSR